MSIVRERLSPGESRAAAIEAARRLLIESGPQAVTLKAVAAEVGKTHANLLHHFGSAAGLQSELARDISERVTAAIGEAVERARRDSIPTLVEVRTYRFMGHSMSDAVSGTYRTKSELEEYMKRDPITLLRTHMQEAGQLTDEQLQKLDEEIKAVVQDAWDFAEASPELPVEALYEDVYADTTT
jgi:TPP-dependent pyruvate/acetoin dehydrogenase alpha subunit